MHNKNNVFIVGSHKTGSRWLVKNIIDLSNILMVKTRFTWGKSLNNLNLKNYKRSLNLVLNGNYNEIEKSMSKNDNWIS